MSATLLELPVGKLVADCPARSHVFEHFGIDYCCGGKKALSDACAEKDIDPDTVLRDLIEADAKPKKTFVVDWSAANLTFICDYVVLRHHQYLAAALPRLDALCRKVRSAHSERHPELSDLAFIFSTFRHDLEIHMAREEAILFPHIKSLEGFGPKPAPTCGTIESPIAVMEDEHEAAGAALELMRKMTGDFTVPPEACNTWRALIDGLKELEEDMHQHVHIENNILFPRATQLEHIVRNRE